MHRFLTVVLVLSFYLVNAQDAKRVKALFQAAEEHLLYEEYDQALPNYLELINIGWENANIHFSIGMCYLNMHNQVKQAIPYLELASANVTKNYLEGNYKEDKAPEEAWFYLAKAYRIAENFSKSINAYQQYRSFLGPTDLYYLDFVDLQIQTCKRAEEMIQNPLNFIMEEPSFNVPEDCYNPAIAGDERTAAFTAFQEVIDPLTKEENWFEIVYFVTGEGGNWNAPNDITYDIASDGYFSTNYLNYGGDFMLLYRDDYGNGNIYYTELENGKWNRIERMPKQISSRANETHACLTKDGSTMYFVSDREGGIGGKDIYSSIKDAKGRWGVPVNLGEVINTPFEEETPFISEDGKTLYFASEAHASMGGYDIFKSTMGADGEWSQPQNIGYPLNTAQDDLFYLPIGDGSVAYMTRASETDGIDRIYRIEFPKTERVIEVLAEDTEAETDSLDTSQLTADATNEAEPTNSMENVTPVVTAPVVTKTIVVPSEYDLKGTLTLDDNNDLDQSFYVHLAKEDGEVIASLSPNPATGEFATKVKPGSYKLTAYGEGYEPASKSIVIQDDQQNPDVLTFLSLKPKMVSTGEYYSIKNVFFDYSSAVLNREGQEEVERLAVVMEKNPSLYIEVTGHTDAHGSEEYNKRLSVDRAQSVVQYLLDRGIDSKRFVTRGMGKEHYIAINQNPDGSDNPEGRRLNRRAEMRVIKSNSDLITIENIYVPDELRYKDQLTYTILLMEREEPLEPSYFSQSGENINNVWMFNTEGGYLYTVGQFTNKADALPVMNKVVDAGFPDAEIISSLEYNELVQKSSRYYKAKMNETDKTVYTIQIAALGKPAPADKFKGLDVDVMHGADGYYRYIVGEYIGKTSAKQALDQLLDGGYHDAFIVAVQKFHE